ncbi:hypothetical protein [Sutcliffiella cohnii]|uniref:hypothetical protein n=1 Tax=Sutcliffiella cohnii TaxID=33932 RepID=UPI0008317036|nr:hypothetical protein [Sutcliffiella cohnii]
MQEMNVYDQESYRLSLSNLIMLKIFHDEGINVKGFTDFMVHVQFNESNCADIFWDGMQHLFESVERFDYGEEVEEFKKAYPELILEDGSYPSPETIFSFKDPSFSEVLNSPLAEDFKRMLPSLSHMDMSEVDIIALPDNTGVVIFCYFSSYYHELVKAMVELRAKATELNNQYKREIKNGVSNKFFNRKSA